MSEELKRLLKDLDSSHWTREVDAVIKLLKELDKVEHNCSVRSVAKLIKKPKSWVGDTFILIKAIHKYPDIVHCENRFQALKSYKEKLK